MTAKKDGLTDLVYGVNHDKNLLFAENDIAGFSK